VWPAFRHEHMVEARVDALELHVETDFEWFAAIRRRSSDPWIYPSFDPQRSDLSAGALWIRASLPGGEVVGTYALRVFETENFYDLMRNGALWFKASATPGHARCDVAEPAPIRGIVGHCGGAWIDPTWRRRGVVQAMCRLARALLAHRFAADHETGLVFEHNYRNGLAHRAYGYPHVVRVIEGYFPPTGTEENVFLCHMSRREMLSPA
jgi:hypothetical protein